MNAAYLLDLFNEDISHAERLLELIEAEFQALSDNDLPQLQEILTNKQPLLAELERHGTIRTQTLLQLQLSADREGLHKLAERSEQGSALLEASDRLTALLEDCQSANLRNGRIIRSSQKSTENLLGILRGNDAPSLYDSNGGTAKIGSKRPLSQA